MLRYRGGSEVPHMYSLRGKSRTCMVAGMELD